MAEQKKCLLREYVAPIDWNVCTLFNHDDALLSLYYLTDYLNIKPFPIKYIFGGIHCKMHGGRFPHFDIPMKTVYKLIDKYEEIGIGCNLTFNKTEITDSDLDDKLSNELLERFNAGKNHGVIINSDKLTEYVQKKYPNLRTIASLVKPFQETKIGKTDDANYYNALIDRYDIVVCNNQRAFEESFMEKIKDPSKLEFIANYTCVQNCPKANDHYKVLEDLSVISRKPMDVKTEKEKKVFDDKLASIKEGCQFRWMRRFEKKGCSSQIFVSDINRLASTYGVKHFKLEGRYTPSMDVLRDILHWCYDPDSSMRTLMTLVPGNVKNIIDDLEIDAHEPKKELQVPDYAQTEPQQALAK